MTVGHVFLLLSQAAKEVEQRLERCVTHSDHTNAAKLNSLISNTIPMLQMSNTDFWSKCYLEKSTSTNQPIFYIVTTNLFTVQNHISKFLCLQKENGSFI